MILFSPCARQAQRAFSIGKISERRKIDIESNVKRWFRQEYTEEQEHFRHRKGLE